MQRRLFFRNAAGLFLAPAAMQFAGTASAATPAVSPIELPPAEDIISSFGWVTDIHYRPHPHDPGGRLHPRLFAFPCQTPSGH